MIIIPREIIRAGRVLDLRLNECSGLVAYDRSGHENHGTISGLASDIWANDIGATFDGVDDGIDCGTDTSLAPQQITVEVWARVGMGGSGEDQVCGRVLTSYALTYYWKDANWYWYINVSWLKVAATAGWNHIVGTYDGNVQRLFLNGSQITLNTLGVSIATPTGALQIAMCTDAGDYFPGRIGEVRVYDRALSATEIAANFDARRRRYGI